MKFNENNKCSENVRSYLFPTLELGWLNNYNIEKVYVRGKCDKMEFRTVLPVCLQIVCVYDYTAHTCLKQTRLGLGN